MYPVTTAEYFTFNVNNSLFITGATGSGKSYLVETLLRRHIKGHSSDDLKLALFDFKAVEFKWLVEHEGWQEYLLFPVVQDPNEGIERFKELAELAASRARSQETHPLIFIAIDECDAAYADNKSFKESLKKINVNARKANMKLIYDTSRPEETAIPLDLLDTFELIMLGEQASNRNYEYLGYNINEMRLLTGHDFNLIDKTNKGEGK